MALGAIGEAGGPAATAALGFPLGGRQQNLPAVIPQLSTPVQTIVIWHRPCALFGFLSFNARCEDKTSSC